MSSKNKFYVVTPIYYANADPHIGSTYTTLAADVLARFHRMVGDKTFFLTGTDEHGAKIAEYAKRAGKSPQEFTDELVAKFELVWDNLAITNDGFIRTTDKRHIKASQKALQHLYDKGFIYKGEYRSEEHTSELQSLTNLVCRLLLEKKKKKKIYNPLYYFTVAPLFLILSGQIIDLKMFLISTFIFFF